MNSLAIIPARGGSKRIPRKNVRDFLGKPIISYSVEAATSSGLFEEVMVSTDDESIADVAAKFGATVPFFRSQKNSDDFSTTADVLSEVIGAYSRLNRVFTNCCCIYPTAPFVSASRLKEGYSLLRKEKVDSVFPVVKFSYPIWRGLTTKEGGKISMIWEENLNKRSQDLPPAFHDAGQWYWFNVQAFLANGRLWADNSSGLEVSELEVQDIDSEVDWQLAELKYKLMRSRAG